MPHLHARTRADAPRAIRTIAEETADILAHREREDRRRKEQEQEAKLAHYARQAELADYRPAARPSAEAPGIVSADVADADITALVPDAAWEPDAPTGAHGAGLAPDTDPDPDPLSPGRHDGWTIERQRLFFAAIADGRTVRTACGMVGMSTASAYAFKRRHNGSAFRLGWEAATLFARDAVADELYDRAMNGVPENVVLRDGRQVQRTRYDNRLAMRLLDRLDRRADRLLGLDDGAHSRRRPRAAAHPASQARAIETVAGHWDEFLALVGTRPDAAAVAGFVADRAVVSLPEPRHDKVPERQLVPLCAEDMAITPDLTDTQRIDIADALAEQVEEHFFADAETGALMTDLPPPAGFAGEEHGAWPGPGYVRAATDAEIAAVAEWEAAFDRFYEAHVSSTLDAARATGANLLARVAAAASLLGGAAPDARAEPALDLRAEPAPAARAEPAPEPAAAVH